MGLSSWDYYRMTPAEFYLAYRGFQKNEWKQWEHTRFLAYNTALTVPRKKGRRLPSLKKWMPLPTDKIVEKEESISKMEMVFKALAEKNKNKNVPGATSS